jgi:hypothetical protein
VVSKVSGGKKEVIPYGQHLGNIHSPYFLKKLRLLIDSFEREATTRCEAFGIIPAYLRVTHPCRALAVIDGGARWSEGHGTFTDGRGSSIHLVFSDLDVLPATEEIWSLFLEEHVTYNAAVARAMSPKGRGHGWRPFREAFGVTVNIAAVDDWQVAHDCIGPAAEAYVRFELHWVENLSLIRRQEPLFGSTPRPLYDSARRCVFLLPHSVTADQWSNLQTTCESGNGLEACTRANWGSQFDSLAQLWHTLCSARYIVADVSDYDPMVLYAVGLVHGMGKHVVLMSRSDVRLPFDLRRTVAIVYDDLQLEMAEMAPLFADAFRALDTTIERPWLLPPVSEPKSLRDPRLVFALMPFSAPWSDQVWNSILRPVFETRGFACQRADEWTGPEIMNDIWAGICSAEIVIVDLTGQNPNVFYELGLLHAVRQDFVLMAQSLLDVPPSLSRYRVLLYDPAATLSDAFRLQLLSAAQDIRKR